MKKHKRPKRFLSMGSIKDNKLEGEVNNSSESIAHNDLDIEQDFDGSFSNPFSDRELCYTIPNADVKESIEPIISLNIINDNISSCNSGNGNIDIPIITDDSDIPESDERMLNRLLFLSDYLNGKYKPHANTNDQEFEDMKWETINETYCLITVDLPRKKAEVVRKYFRRLDTTYAKQDGTYYSKVTKGELAKEIIDDLIEVYPWYETDKGGVKVNWDEFRKSNTNVIKISQGVHFTPENTDNHVYNDRLKYAIGSLGKSVEKLNEILSGK